MNRSNWVVLEDNSRFREVRKELFHVGLRSLAMRALEVGELNQHEVLCGSPVGRSIGPLLQERTVLRKRLLAERNDLIPDNDVLSVRRGKEGEAVRLLFSGLVADQNRDLADPFHLCLLDCLDLPDIVVIEAEIRLHERRNDLLGGSCRCKIGGVGLWKDRRGGCWRSSGRDVLCWG